MRIAPSVGLAPGGAERALAHTRRRLTLVTMSLVVGLLLLAAGVAAVLASRALDASVDNALIATAEAAVGQLGTGAAPVATEAPSQGPGDIEDSGDDSAVATDDHDGGGSAEDSEEHRRPAPADTVVLELDAAGGVIATRAAVPIAGLPDRGSIAAAAAGGRDLRTIVLGGTPLRVLTIAVEPEHAGGVAFVQAAFVLTLHDRQGADLVWALLVVVLLGVLGAALVAWVVVDRALAPVRDALEHERAFVAAASHELRTPVALIRSTAEVLRREKLIEPEGVQLLSDVEAEADRLGRLVGDLAALSAAQATPMDRRTRVDLSTLVRDVVRRAQPLAASRGIRLEAAAGAGIEVDSDPDRLIQVALILIDNALRVTPAGRAVRVSAAGRGRTAELSVEDEGPGVPEADRTRIFEPFVRGGADGDEPGSGLGLAVARSLVERLGGRIGLEPAASGGARFTVAMPLA